MQSSTLTLLTLVIGFTLAMAVSRSDQRKTYEAEEANAIGTEYLRADLLPEADGAKVKALLRDYVDLRIKVNTNRDWFFSFDDEGELDQLNARTADLQNQLWQAVLPIAAAKSTPTVTLAVSGMNDVINSQGYAQAATWNRIPKAT